MALVDRNDQVLAMGSLSVEGVAKDELLDEGAERATKSYNVWYIISQYHLRMISVANSTCPSPAPEYSLLAQSNHIIHNRQNKAVL